MTNTIKQKIKAVNVNWNTTVANDPELEVVVDSVPMIHKDLVWDSVAYDGGELVLAELTPGAFAFNAVHPEAANDVPRHVLGSAGHVQSFKLSDGRTIASNDIWSSNCDSINEAFGREGDDKLIDVIFVVYDSNGARNRFCGYITVGLFKELCVHVGIYLNEGRMCCSAHATKVAKKYKLADLQNRYALYESYDEDKYFDKTRELAKLAKYIEEANMHGYAVVPN